MNKFKNIFSGLTIAYGQYQPGERGENGKQQGKAFIVRGTVTEELWENHLTGKGPALGIIPITENNDCRWGCIDIDEYNLNHVGLIKSIRNLKLPLIVCRSKSGGAHVFLFTKENIPASLMQSKLKSFAILLGYEGSEIFPKQTEILVDRGDTGNFLNLPYHNEMKGLRYAINDTGAGCTLEEFYKLYDEFSLRKEEVEQIKTKEKKIEEAFPGGPPCLNKLASTGFGEGSRNNALFNVAVYYKQAHPDTWEDEIVKANMKFMEPPLSNNEVQQLIKSVNRKGYDKYRCKDAPINAVCQSGLCN
ncbi:primase C-terminal domain-containing protein [bacterium]|nr:primase C-terminal domain-containing protein [bacterium]